MGRRPILQQRALWIGPNRPLAPHDQAQHDHRIEAACTVALDHCLACAPAIGLPAIGQWWALAAAPAADGSPLLLPSPVRRRIARGPSTLGLARPPA